MRTQWTTKGNRDAGSSCLCDWGLHRYLRNFGGWGVEHPKPPSVRHWHVHHHHHHQWLDSPLSSLAFLRNFGHSSLLRANFFQFLTPSILISWSTSSSHRNFGLTTLLTPSGMVLNIFLRVLSLFIRSKCPATCQTFNFDMIWYDIFINCNWVVTRWQQYSTHLHTNSTQNDTKQTIHRTTQQFGRVLAVPRLG